MLFLFLIYNRYTITMVPVQTTVENRQGFERCNKKWRSRIYHKFSTTFNFSTKSSFRNSGYPSCRSSLTTLASSTPAWGWWLLRTRTCFGICCTNPGQLMDQLVNCSTESGCIWSESCLAGCRPNNSFKFCTALKLLVIFHYPSVLVTKGLSYL